MSKSITVFRVIGKILRIRARFGSLDAPLTLYDLSALVLRPSAWWGRLEVAGLERVPKDGPLLVVPNHDSQWDPLVIGLALYPRRQLRFLARADLWQIPLLGRILDAIGQIKIERGAGDRQALENAVAALARGEAVCVYPEGRLSRGEHLRARSGVGYLTADCPRARVVLCAHTGTTDFARFPRRPRVKIEFFEPRDGQPHPGEEPAALAARLLGELRARVPPVPAGRKASRDGAS
jgi:1-acyl-sn-glycerol-3-phosphate acyltransferase